MVSSHEITEWLRLGSVYKLSGKRRRPWVARKTVGLDDEGNQLYHFVGYYEKRDVALQALAKYNENPNSVDADTITFAEIYERWKKESFKYETTLDKNERARLYAYSSAFKRCKPLHNMKFVEIRKSDMQPIVDNCDKGHETKKKIKVLFNQLYKYAMENDITKDDYARFVKVESREETDTTGREPFTRAEIDVLWENLDKVEHVDTMLIMIYTGLRPSEFLGMESENVDVSARTMRGGMKTKAGRNRVIPISKKILPLVEKRLADKHQYLIVNPNTGNQENYFGYYERKWKKVMTFLGMVHKPHDCRHTFASLMDTAGANKLCIKRIMGHKTQDLTDRVYTHKDIQELIDAVDLI